MAIINSKKAETNILDQISDQSGKSSDSNKYESSKSPVYYKKGFFRSVGHELKLTNWPNFKYTMTWTLIVILFTVILSSFFGTLDKYFQDGIQYVNCTANFTKLENPDKDLGQCGRELAQGLLFRE